ncbi:MAG: helix-turn-helix transcriptional regulator [Spirochaetota bacterium]
MSGSSSEQPFLVRERIIDVRRIPAALLPHAQLIIVTEGAIAVTGIDDAVPRDAPYGFFIPRKHATDIECGTRALIAEMVLDDRLVDEVRSRLAADALTPFVFNQPHSVSIPHALAELRSRIDALSAEQSAKRPGYRSLITLSIVEFFILLQREFAPIPVKKVPIDVIIEEMQANPFDEYDLTVMAERAGIAPANFSRTFRDRTGKPPFEYINHLRIQRSCILLKRTDRSILDIAYDVGYNNLSFFNRYFRKVMNMSPREYRDASRK